MLNRLQKLVESTTRKVLERRARGWTVRGLSRVSRKAFRQAFHHTRGLRRLSYGGAMMGLGVILVLVTLYDRVKAAMQRHFEFVRTHFDQAARGWKRQPELQGPLLQQRFWPLYALALESRDRPPPYQDEESFLAQARQALAADANVLEGLNAEGEPARIPFRQPQKLFSTPPLSAAKNSVNELRFSWYRELRDRHLGWRRFLAHLTESNPFENYILLGLRRDVLTYVARGVKAHQAEVRLEDVLGTSDDRFIPEEARRARHRIRAYVGRKLSRRPGWPRQRIYLALEDGLNNAVRALVRGDPEYLTGFGYRSDPEGGFQRRPLGFSLREDLDGLLADYGPVKGPPALDLERLGREAHRAEETAEALLAFLERHDPGGTVIADVGDLRAARMALQLDGGLRRALGKGRDPAHVLTRLGEVVARQAEYDRALLELRGVYHGVWADFGLYNRFLVENFTRYADEHPEVDYDPLLLRWVLPFTDPLRRGYRRLRQRLARLVG
ncbi:hypothetical protein [Arhodomonas sp. SL1]|uniref:hypothetical protein n=1 Tax=Arhodomonas sp. SL1 TaxID=3425691 RepID=UPI003F880B58